MARRVFFSFHYENDIWRANIIRNSWVTKPDSESAGFIDAAEFEKIKRGGDLAIKKWINDQLYGTSVTIVLIGSETSYREYVKYELEKSYERGNGIIGIYIHNLKDRNGDYGSKGSTIFGAIGKDSRGNDVYLGSSYPFYDWVNNDGYNNLGKWVEEAAKKAGR